MTTENEPGIWIEIPFMITFNITKMVSKFADFVKQFMTEVARELDGYQFLFHLHVHRETASYVAS